MLLPFLIRCVDGASRAGSVWFGAHCDTDQYPKTFDLFEGSRNFIITQKHIAAYLAFVCFSMIENAKGGDYDLIFDKDSTKLDWGLANRMQATHFARISERAIVPSSGQLPLLELADVAAYVYGRALSAQKELGNRKYRRFLSAMAAMRMQTYTFAYMPGK